MTTARTAVATVLALMFMAPHSATGQAGSGKIEGRVSDAQQLALAQAVVELQDLQRNAVQKTVADGTGHYEFNDVPPGMYRLAATRSGFAVGEQGPFTIEAGEMLVVDATLKPLPVFETVTVVAENDHLVASKTEIPLRELPVTVNTVPREIIEQQNATNMVAALNNVPAADAFTAYGVYDYFIFRGFGFDNINGSAVLLNGLRLEGNRINSQINSVESVEVLKGPASMLYGTEATGGTINVIQKKPLSTPAYEIAIHGGRWGTAGIELGATGPIGAGKLLYRLDTGFSRSDGFRGAGYNRFNVTPALYWNIRPADQLNVHITYNRDRYRTDAGIPLLSTAQNAFNPFLANIIPDIPLSRRFNTPGNFEHTNDAVFQVFYQHLFTEKVRFRSAFQYRFFDDHYFQSEILSVDPSTPTTVDRRNFYFFNHNRPYLLQNEVIANFRLGWEHQVLIGHEYNVYKLDRARSNTVQFGAVPPIDLYNPVETAMAPSSFPLTRFQYFRNSSNAVLLQDYIRLHPRLQLLLGGRFDAFRRTGRVDPVVGGVRTEGTPEFIEQNPFTYRVALNAQLLPFLSAYSSYGTSFAAQTSLSTDGKQLKPQTGSQFEAGARLNFFNDHVVVNPTFYHIILRNVSVARTQGIIDQAGQQYAKGAELEVRGRASQRLTFFGSYGFTQAAYDNFVSEDGDGSLPDLRGRTPSFVARHTARMWSTYEFPRGFVASLGSRYISARPTDQFNHYFMGGFTLWDAAFSYRRSKMQYGVNITNLFNKKRYFVAAAHSFIRARRSA